MWRTHSYPLCVPNFSQSLRQMEENPIYGNLSYLQTSKCKCLCVCMCTCFSTLVSDYSVMLFLHRRNFVNRRQSPSLITQLFKWEVSAESQIRLTGRFFETLWKVWDLLFWLHLGLTICSYRLLNLHDNISP